MTGGSLTIEFRQEEGAGLVQVVEKISYDRLGDTVSPKRQPHTPQAGEVEEEP